VARNWERRRHADQSASITFFSAPHIEHVPRSR
jgi:hypothetical protein